MTARPSAASTLARWLPAAMLVVVVLVHLPTLGQPLVDRHNFRQTQTAFTARIYAQEGIDLLHPKLPILGAPWEVPFEFPLFQAAAALVIDAGVPEDTALRATGLATFVLAGALLWLLVRRQAGRLGAGIALAVFCFSPLAMEWSRAALIEFLALALSIGFALAGLHWRESRAMRWFVAALALGCLAAMVKITTSLFWIAPFALLGVWRDDMAATARTRIGAWALVLGPLAAGFAWTRWADAIKAATPATEWLTSTALAYWNFGNLPQRFEVGDWSRVFSSVVFLAGGVVIALLAIPIAIWALERRQVRFWVWIVVTLVGPVLLFFNLYQVHDYYALAITASVAALVGVGGASLAGMRSWFARGFLAAGVIAWAAVWVLCVPYWTRTFDAVSDPEGVLPLAAQIERETKPGQLVAIVGRDWSPGVLYYADRWGYMVRAVDPPELLGELLAQGYVIYDCPFTNERDHCTLISPAQGGG